MEEDLTNIYFKVSIIWGLEGGVGGGGGESKTIMSCIHQRRALILFLAEPLSKVFTIINFRHAVSRFRPAQYLRRELLNEVVKQ